MVDAFTDKIFSGNPAAVCIMEKWVPDELMIAITTENNLSETAFAVKEEEGRYKLRWFTPGGEIDLCGHATLGTAFVIMRYYDKGRTRVDFDTMSGRLTVNKKGGLYEMDFPAYELKEVEVTDAMAEAIGARPVKAYMGRDLLCVFDSEETIFGLNPDQGKVEALGGLLLQTTAPGKEYDCVSRTFAPKMHVAEDPVCGSGHCHIVPYWSKVKGKNEIIAYQASKRSGVLYCKMEGKRIKMAGKVAPYAEAELFV